MDPSIDIAWHEGLLHLRREKDAWLRRDPHSPIENRASFRGLAYFEPDVRYRLRLKPEPLHGASTVAMQTSDGETRIYRPAARLPFALDGRPLTLTAYEQGHDWFVPFRDATSGKESYGAGRYLEVEPGTAVTLDFNKAYNPYCAYSDAFSCPFPPHENWLDVPIRAGEKALPKA